MTNKEKFIEIMNQTFNAGFTMENFRFNSEHYMGPYCSPCGIYKTRVCCDYTCEGCKSWWGKEYVEPEPQPLTLEELQNIADKPV